MIDTEQQSFKKTLPSRSRCTTMSQFLRRAGKLMFGRYLLLTNTVSCSSLLAIGDVSTQTLEMWAGLSNKRDWSRTGRLFVLGALLGPFNHAWYSFLDKALVGKAAKTVVKKIILDQSCAAPIFAFMFFMGIGTLEGQPLHTSWGELKDKFIQVYVADLMLWPAAQAVNFYLLPPRYRVVYIACVTCVWNSFLSFMKHKDNLTPSTGGVVVASQGNLEKTETTASISVAT